MEAISDSDDQWNELKTSYAQHLATGVDVPTWAGRSLNPAELAVLGAIRDAAYKAPDGVCSLPVDEIARVAEVSQRTVIRAITIAIAAGVIERDGSNLLNRRIKYKIG